MQSSSRLIATAALMFLATLAVSHCRAEPPAARSSDGWIELIGADGSLDAFQGEHPIWAVVGSVALDPENPKRLVGTPGKGVVFNGPGGRAPNLLTKESFGDVELHLEFNVPKGSNSGVKLEAVYEIQIFDCFGLKTVTASHSGGIYPRAELLPKYHHIDEGYPPLLNAALAPGEWQTLDITWRAPKFDPAGKKSRSARFVKVVLNGKVVQDNVEVTCPTGNNWRSPEKPTGPILLQGDHGPIAFRNVRVRPIP